MKKVCLLVIPFLTLSFLASCNKGGGGDEPIPLEECTWKEISEVSKTGKASEWFKVGDTKTVKVNNQNHKVRIIGFNQDEDKDGNKIGITFEFVNPISDENGYSLATQWNDIAKDVRDKATRNYLDSSVRKALINEGNGHILWAQKGAIKWSNEEGGLYTNKSVLEMLPSELTKELKAPTKYINMWDESEQSNDGWKEQTINDKLFLLSPAEMGKTTHEYEEGHTIAYSYYKNHAEEKDAIRIKKQVKRDEVLKDSSKIPWDAGQDFQYKEYPINNYAGYNFNATDIGGARLWLRSPAIDTPEGYADRAWMVGADGALYYYYVFNYALAVAPAFCI